MKKAIALTLIFALVLALSGCMAVIQDVSVFKDGSGEITVSSGYTEEGWELIASSEGETAPPDLSTMQMFTYNGVDYYGTVEKATFKNVTQLNDKMATEAEDGTKTHDVLVERLDNGDFTVTVRVRPAENTETEEMDPETEAAYDELMAEMAGIYRLAFPYNVVQTEGATDGVSIEGMHLTIDYLAAQESAVTEEVYKFLASPNNRLTFTDVLKEAWYYDAVTALAEGGLVTGMGNNLFAPDGTLTRAQFCQILARAKHLPTGPANNYWAYKAIEACLKEGYLIEDGAITPEAFDAPITREAAVTAMYLAKKEGVAVGGSITADMIPDFAEISAEYQDHILAAYNCGITAGMDESRTFAPKETLTRAQVCQLFYNLNWTK